MIEAMATYSCALTPAERPARGLQWESLRPHLISFTRPSRTGGVALFRDEPGVESTLEELIRLEAGCCSFMRMTAERLGGNLALDLKTPEGAEAVIDAIHQRLSPKRFTSETVTPS